MNLDELRTVQNKERSKDSLQHLRESFYAEVGEYIADLKAERERAAERAESQFDDPEVNRLTDEIHTAEDVVEAVYERRVGKVVKRASLAAAGMPADEEGLTAEEQELFTSLVEEIEANKAEVLDILAGESDAARASADADASPVTDSTPHSDPAEPDDADTETDVSAADLMGGGSPVDDEPASAAPTDDSDGDDPRPAPDEAAAVAGAPDGPEVDALDDRQEADSDPDDSTDPTEGLDDRTTVRITRDVGEIFGVDERTYELASEDVVTLPEENAGPLVERGAAERLTDVF
ncbi:DNA replication complex subunit Gins51 [Halorussus marinus]|uniref:DNA replication complex subunit Gins51 n=1 Tax=Halorussus marinus TaxID=2505976 RepID=UPI001092159F|nr:hypothetical protein [Halorussus marinus]